MCSFQATNLSDICFLMKLSQKTHWYVKVDELKPSRCFHSILSLSVSVVDFVLRENSELKPSRCFHGILSLSVSVVDFVLRENSVRIPLSKTQHFTQVYQQRACSVGFETNLLETQLGLKMPAPFYRV